MNTTEIKKVVDAIKRWPTDHNKAYGAIINGKAFCGYRGRNTWPSKQGLTKALDYAFFSAARRTGAIKDPWWKGHDLTLSALKDAIKYGYIKIIEIDLTK